MAHVASLMVTSTSLKWHALRTRMMFSVMLCPNTDGRLKIRNTNMPYWNPAVFNSCYILLEKIKFYIQVETNNLISQGT